MPALPCKQLDVFEKGGVFHIINHRIVNRTTAR